MSIAAAFMVPHPPLIVPSVGRGSEAKVEKTIKSYETVADKIAELRPDTIIISSPHAVMYSDYFHISPGRSASGSFADFGAPQTRFSEEYDEELVKQISSLAKENDIAAGTLGEKKPELDHGTMVPLYFIRQKYKEGRIVRVGLSGLSLTEHYRLGQTIKHAVGLLGRRAVFVASGDLSHKLKDYGPYGFAPQGPVYDERIMDVCERAAFSELFDFDEDFLDKAAECGHRSFVIMAGALDGETVKAQRLSHEDVTGVGYGVCAFIPTGISAARACLDIYLEKKTEEAMKKREGCDEYVRLAYASAESYILYGKKLSLPDGLPAEMLSQRAGAFVSIHKNGQLRGCIGTFLPTQDCIAKEIIENAVSASTRDPRFSPITKDELALLEINVDILSEPEEIASEEQLDPKRYGVIVSSGYRRGLLLPDLEGVDTVEQQIDIARRKAGIAPGERIALQRFKVVRHY